LIWAAFLRRRNPASRFLRRAARAALLPLLRFNQSITELGPMRTFNDRPRNVRVHNAKHHLCAPRSLALHSLPPHHTRPTRQTLLCFDVRLFLFFRELLANQHVAMPVALNQNLTFEDAMARRIYVRRTNLYAKRSACLALKPTHKF
jgi:hypothetical protein